MNTPLLDESADDVSLLLQGLMDNAPLGAVFFDRDYRYVRLNQKLAEINGLPIAAHLGRRLADVLPAHAASVEPLLEQVFTTGRRIENVEISGETPAQPGITRNWLTGYFPVTDNGVVRYVGIVVIEITQRKQSERRLELLAEAGIRLASSLAYEESIHSVLDLLCEDLVDWAAVDLLQSAGSDAEDSVPDNLIVRLCVAQAEKQRAESGIGRSEPLSSDYDHGAPAVIRTGQPRFFASLTDKQLTAAAGSEAQAAHWRNIDAGSLLIVPLQARGVVLGALTLIRTRRRPAFTVDDLQLAKALGLRLAMTIDNARLFADMRAAQEELRAMNEALELRIRERTLDLERSNRELEEFAYVASHDLQEPLRKITAFGDRLQSRYASELDERAQDYIVRMQQAARRMHRLINDLLVLSRVTTQGRDFEMVDLRAVLGDVVEDLDTLIEESDGQIDVGALPMVAGDRSQLHQLFLNLIVNAFKFRTDERPPHVQVYVSGKEEHDLASYYRISVADNGIGFEQTYSDRIFQPFQRLHGRGEYAGTGMGLAICRRIIERHGGEIEAGGEPGRGAIFTVTLPAQLTDRHPSSDD